jgi:hypothetical protein
MRYKLITLALAGIIGSGGCANSGRNFSEQETSSENTYREIILEQGAQIRDLKAKEKELYRALDTLIEEKERERGIIKETPRSVIARSN